MTSNLQKPDLSKDTTGPFVTRDGRKAEYVGSTADGSFHHVFRIAQADKLHLTNASGLWSGSAHDHPLDIFLAPKEPKTVFVNWYGRHSVPTVYPSRTEADLMAVGGQRLALLQLEVDDQGVPVHNSVVRRVEG